jgi:hypothetical protein
MKHVRAADKGDTPPTCPLPKLTHLPISSVTAEEHARWRAAEDAGADDAAWADEFPALLPSQPVGGSAGGAARFAEGRGVSLTPQAVRAAASAVAAASSSGAAASASGGAASGRGGARLAQGIAAAATTAPGSSACAQRGLFVGAGTDPAAGVLGAATGSSADLSHRFEAAASAAAAAAGGSHSFPHHNYSKDTVGDWASGAAMQATSVACPFCHTRTLLHRRDVLMCQCGFRLDTTGGLSAGHLGEAIADGHAAHRARCGATPEFGLRDDFGGVRVLTLQCATCGDVHVLI